MAISRLMAFSTASILNEVEGRNNDWKEICDKQAKDAAKSLANVYITTIKNRVSLPEFRDTFIEIFKSQYEDEVQRRQNNPNSEPDIPEEETASSKQPKAFFRRLSFKSLRNPRGLFARNDDARSRIAKIVVECRKEGLVNHLLGDQPDCGLRWEKCRLALIKTSGGYMLEFYAPPKSTKPRCGLFCFLILTARETTALEMPDHENTFVLQAENQMEYVIEAPDAHEMRSWLATIKYCIRAPRSVVEQEEARAMLNSGSASSSNENKNDGTSIEGPDLPPRADGPSSSRRHSGPLNIPTGTRVTVFASSDGHGETNLDFSTLLKEYPWFHGTLPRAEATLLVLHDGPSGHGIYLVRQSETRKGEFVLTFNFHGRAKHLRCTLNDHGQCRIQHYWFPSILEMLEHFQDNSIPLESGGNAHVTLTKYVVVPLSQHGPASGRHWPAHGVERRPAPHPDIIEVVTSNGSVRIRTESLERLNGSTGSVGSGRAVDNAYSFV